ncbi:hypothetical protein [Chitinophaga sp.]|uniref:hypothetical protein n=1 Tax=Chitinophaga sp. TaxID=1869181 RepID=UPI002F92C2DB
MGYRRSMVVPKQTFSPVALTSIDLVRVLPQPCAEVTLSCICREPGVVQEADG